MEERSWPSGNVQFGLIPTRFGLLAFLALIDAGHRSTTAAGLISEGVWSSNPGMVPGVHYRCIVF